MFWPFTFWINCSSDLKNFANSWPSASNFQSFSRSLEQFFLTVGQINFGNKIPFLIHSSQHYQFPIYVQQAWEDPYQRSLTGLWQHNSTQQKHGSVNATCWVSMIYTEYYGRVSSHYTAALSDFIPPLPHTLILSYGSVSKVLALWLFPNFSTHKILHKRFSQTYL